MQIVAHGPNICSAWQPGIADKVVTTERSDDLKFDLFSYRFVQKRWVIYPNLDQFVNF